MTQFADGRNLPMTDLYDAADQAANWAQNGGSKGEQDIAAMMDQLRDGDA